jgi:hypothetical protein
MKSNTMKLKYRGIEYDYNPVVVETTVETTETAVAGKYRGLDWRFRNLKNPPMLLPTANLTYRGVAYNKGDAETSYPSQAPQTENTPVFSTEAKARCLMFNRTKSIKKRQQVMLSRAAESLGLTINDYWNHIQGKVHPTFRHDYDRLGASMS